MRSVSGSKNLVVVVTESLFHVRLNACELTLDTHGRLVQMLHDGKRLTRPNFPEHPKRRVELPHSFTRVPSGYRTASLSIVRKIRIRTLSKCQGIGLFCALFCCSRASPTSTKCRSMRRGDEAVVTGARSRVALCGRQHGVPPSMSMQNVRANMCHDAPPSVSMASLQSERTLRTLPSCRVKVAGILLVNTSDLLERAREALRMQPKIKNVKQLKRQIPLAPDDWMLVEETEGTIHSRDEVLTPPF